jgi:hypothetical protein
MVTINALVRDRETQCSNTLTLNVTLYPLPEAALSIQNGQAFCQNDPEVEIALAPGTLSEIELVQVTINGTPTKILNPSQYAAQGEPETVAIAAQIRNRKTQCENTLQYKVTINPLPNSEFQIEQPDTTLFLTSDTAISLIPAQPGGIFQARVGTQDISSRVVTGTEFSPDRVRFSETETEKTVTLIYKITQNGCSHESTRDVTIVMRPAIEVLNLLMDGEIPIRTQLQGDRTFPLSFFTTHCQFEPEVTGKVTSVVFTYTSPTGAEETMAAVNTAPYRMPRDWEPSIGTHEITAQPYSEPDGRGVEGEVQSFRITITDDRGEGPQIEPNPIAPGTRPQPNRPPNLFGMMPFLDHSSPESPPPFDALNSLLTPASNWVTKPAITALLPRSEAIADPQAPTQTTASHPVPISPESAELDQPRRTTSPKLIQALAMGAIAAILSLTWVYSTTKPSGTPQPSSSTPTTQPAP